MIDLVSAMWTAVQDPLVLALGLLVIGAVMARLLFKRHLLARAIVRFVFFVLLTIVLLHGQIVPYQPTPSTGPPFHNSVVAALEIAWWLGQLGSWWASCAMSSSSSAGSGKASSYRTS